MKKSFRGAVSSPNCHKRPLFYIYKHKAETEGAVPPLLQGKGAFTTMFRIQRPKKLVVHFRRVWPNRSWHIPALMGAACLLLAASLALGVMELGTGDSAASA